MDYILKSLSLIGNSYERKEFDFIYDVRFTICEGKKVVYNNDGTFNRVRVSENIFVNVCNNDLKKEMKKYLKGLVGEFYTIIESGQKIYLEKDFANEYAYSKYTSSLSNRERIVKGKILSNLKDIIENSRYRDYLVNLKDKHKIDAKYGFYKYISKFSVMHNDKEEIYKCVILIRNDANKRKYLYDILKIKKID